MIPWARRPYSRSLGPRRRAGTGTRGAPTRRRPRVSGSPRWRRGCCRTRSSGVGSGTTGIGGARRSCSTAALQLADALAAVRGPFKDAFGPHCFYCRARLPADNPIDHVLPWSLVGIDGLANLVLACARCNTDKRHALPAVDIVDRVLGRDRDSLEQIADQIRWPTEYQRVQAAARGIYRGQPPGVATWAGYKSSVRWDVAFAPRWLGRSTG